MKSLKFSTLRRIKNKLEETFSLNGVIAIVIIVASIIFYAIRVNVPNFDIWSVLDGAIVNVVCSAAIFLIFDIRDAKRSQRLVKIVSTRMRKYMEDWDRAVKIMKRDTNERLLEIDKLDLSQYQPNCMIYALGNGAVERPSYHKVLRTETNKLVTRMKELRDVYFDCIDPKVIKLIDEMQDSWSTSILTFSMIPDENSVTNVIGGKNEKNIVHEIRQITDRLKKIDRILGKTSNP